jgi:hypothetical protein
VGLAIHNAPSLTAFFVSGWLPKQGGTAGVVESQRSSLIGRALFLLPQCRFEQAYEVNLF